MIQSIFFKNQLAIKEAFHKFIKTVNLIILVNQEREKFNCYAKRNLIKNQLAKRKDNPKNEVIYFLV